MELAIASTWAAIDTELEASFVASCNSRAAPASSTTITFAVASDSASASASVEVVEMLVK